jgi:hypothetical protein
VCMCRSAEEALVLQPYVLTAKDVDTLKSKLSEISSVTFPPASKIYLSAPQCNYYSLIVLSLCSLRSYIKYTAALEKLLGALDSSGSLAVLEAQFLIFKETAHVHATKIRAALNAEMKKIILFHVSSLWNR